MKINSKISSCLNWAITILWICFIVWLWCYSGIDRPTELNGIGDFLAGVFAPLAFFWLVRGFYQQGKGLEQNSIALNLQAQELQASTEALNLQVQEMKASVEQQKQMAEYQRLEIEERHNSIHPLLDIDSGFDVTSIKGFYFSFSVINISDNDARNVVFQTNVSGLDGNCSKSFPIILKGKEMSFIDFFTENESINYKQKIPFERVIHLKYESIYGRMFEEEYLLEVGMLVGPTQRRITKIR